MLLHLMIALFSSSCLSSTAVSRKVAVLYWQQECINNFEQVIPPSSEPGRISPYRNYLKVAKLTHIQDDPAQLIGVFGRTAPDGTKLIIALETDWMAKEFKTLGITYRIIQPEEVFRRARYVNLGGGGATSWRLHDQPVLASAVFTAVKLDPADRDAFDVLILDPDSGMTGAVNFRVVPFGRQYRLLASFRLD